MEELQEQKKSTLESIQKKKAEFESRLLSVKNEGTESDVVRKHSGDKLQEITRTENKIKKIEEDKSEDLKRLQHKKNEAIGSLKKDKRLCESRLNKLVEDIEGSTGVKEFDEKELRTRLTDEKERDVAELSSQYDASIARTERAINNIDSEYAGILSQELSYVEDDQELLSVYNDLIVKQNVQELPQIITDSLLEPVDAVMQRNKINDGRSVYDISSRARSLDDLSLYTPEWLKTLIFVGIPLLVAGLTFYVLGGVHFGFVGSVINGIASLLLWGLIALIGYGILFMFTGTVGGVIAAIVCFLIAMHWHITLPYGITNGAEWIVKIFICGMVGSVVYGIVQGSGMGRGLITASMKLGPLKKSALLRQGYEIQENVDS